MDKTDQDEIAGSAVTTVIDAGARYGMHPSWRGFGGALRYFAFEPDVREAQRLREQAQPPGYEIINWGLSKTGGKRVLRVAKHRGCCSFLEVNRTSDWFGRYRPGEGEVESTVAVDTCSIDEFSSERELTVDFLKVDTEGTELEVLEGADRELTSHVLGLRVGVGFQAAYKGQALFPDIQAYLDRKGFFLVNLDYFGRGVPRYALFRNPDPLSLDEERYGVIVATDGVWLKPADWVFGRHCGDNERLAYAVLKYACFCFLNHAPDLALDSLVEFADKRGGAFGAGVASSAVYLAARRTCAAFLGRWRVYPDSQWEVARETFRSVFGLELPSGSAFWELMQSL